MSCFVHVWSVMVALLFLLLAPLLLFVAAEWWRSAWRKAEIDSDPELLYWLLASTGAAGERRAGTDRRGPVRDQERRAG